MSHGSAQQVNPYLVKGELIDLFALSSHRRLGFVCDDDLRLTSLLVRPLIAEGNVRYIVCVPFVCWTTSALDFAQM